jgi:hypothetical protein
MTIERNFATPPSAPIAGEFEAAPPATPPRARDPCSRAIASDPDAQAFDAKLETCNRAPFELARQHSRAHATAPRPVPNQIFTRLAPINGATWMTGPRGFGVPDRESAPPARRHAPNPKAPAEQRTFEIGPGQFVVCSFAHRAIETVGAETQMTAPAQARGITIETESDFDRARRKRVDALVLEIPAGVDFRRWLEIGTEWLRAWSPQRQ